jgi:hypothetical protein
MIATIIIVSIAFYWLLKESDYLRVNLCFALDVNIDYQVDFDGSDCVLLDDYLAQHMDCLKEFNGELYKGYIEIEYGKRRKYLKPKSTDYQLRRYYSENYKDSTLYRNTHQVPYAVTLYK